MISHQAAFFKRKLNDIVGLYDETIKYGADWHFIIISVCKYNATYLHLNFKMAICSADGLKCNPSEFGKIHAEKIMVLRKEFPAFVDDYLFYDKLEEKKISNRLSSFVSQFVLVIKSFVKNIIK